MNQTDTITTELTTAELSFVETEDGPVLRAESQPRIVEIHLTEGQVSNLLQDTLRYMEGDTGRDTPD